MSAGPDVVRSPGGTGSDSRLGDAETIRIAFICFSVLWALHVQAHYASYQTWFESVPTISCVVASLYLLMRPSSKARLLFSGSTYCVAWFTNLPNVPNHETVGTFLSLALASVIVAEWSRSRNSPAAESDPFVQFVPIARAVVLVMYFWSVFHKLNEDFLFSSDVTCAALFYEGYRDRFPMLPRADDWMNLAMAWGTVIIEAAIPLLLVFRRSRVLGVAAAWAFHWALSLNSLSGFYNFTSLLFALFLLFAPGRFYVELRDLCVGELRSAALRLMSIGHWKAAARGVPFALIIGIAILLGIAGFRQVAGMPLMAVNISENFTFALWMAISLPMTAIVFVALLRVPLSDTAVIGNARVVPRLLWAFPVLFAIWGSTPYLGLKTENSLAMFSNLRTEKNGNHLFVPEGAKIFRYQDDAVSILSFSRGGGEEVFGDQSFERPYEALRTWIARRGIDHVRYVRNGVVTEATRGDGSDDFEQSLLTRKFMTFRTYRPDGANPCLH